MKIERIEITNLNSLYGTHEIDLARDLRSAPLFLIMGPTGAGKSTILDAVCLALFGQTPRLVKRRTSTDIDDDDPRNIMSRGTASCSAELVFSKTRNGVRERYRAVWSCLRARKDPLGKHQSPQRSLEQYSPLQGTWTTLVSDHRLKVFEPVFSGVLENLTVSDFQRSVLLAQGEFAAFLQASEDERAAILERLTDTGEYKRLGQHANGMRKAAESALQVLEARLSALKVPEDAELVSLQERVDKAQRMRAEIEKRLRATRSQLSWIQHRDVLAADLRQTAERWRALEQEEHSFSADQLRLDQHMRCVQAVGVLAERRKLHRAVTARSAELADLRESLTTAESKLAAHQMSHSSAQDQLRDARAALSRQTPELQQARAVRVQAVEATQQAKAALTHHRSCVVEERRIHRETEQLQSEVSQVAAQRSHLNGILEGLTHLDPVMARQVDLQSAYGALQQATSDLNRREQALLREQDLLAQLRQERADLRRRDTALERDLASRQAETAEQEHRLTSNLGDASDPVDQLAAWEDQLVALQERIRTLQQLAKLDQDVKTAQDAVREHGVVLADLERSHESMTPQLLAAEADLARVESALQEKRDWLGDLQYARSLSEDRARLVGGKPCPLCGSEDHPYAADGSREETDQRLSQRVHDLHTAVTKLEQERTQAQHQLSTLKTRSTQLAVSISTRKERAEEAIQGMARILADRQVTLSTLPGGLQGQQVPEALHATRTASTTLLARKQALEEAWSTLLHARRTLRDWESKHQANLTQHQILTARLADKEDSTSQEEQAIRGHRAELAQQTTALVAELEELGLQVEELPDGGFDLDRALHQINDLVHRRADVSAQLSALQHRHDQVRDRFHAHERRWERAQVQADQAERALHAAAEERDKLEQRLQALLGGRDPEAVAHQLTQTLAHAEAEATRAEASLQEATATVVRLTALEEGSQKQLNHHVAEQESVEARWTALLQELGFVHSRDLEAALLDPDEVTRLQAIAEHLQRRLAAAQTAREIKSGALQAHLQALPADLDPHTSEDEAVGQLSELEEQRVTLLQDQARLTDRLSEGQRGQAEHRALTDRRKRARSAAQTWRRMHDLIGKRDGDQFKWFAQVLNLGELIERANHRLQDLSPRYQLAPAMDREGRPRLAFAVRDSFQADQLRPVTTLSGGETFLVSLSLALALADYRSVQMPIETLLLDEGFGTLDRETIHTALMALEQLRSTGTQVGVISHLSGLQDRIEARIVVTPVGNGRSKVHCELGA